MGGMTQLSHDGEPPVSGQASTTSRAMITHSERSPLAKSILFHGKSAYLRERGVLVPKGTIIDLSYSSG